MKGQNQLAEKKQPGEQHGKLVANYNGQNSVYKNNCCWGATEHFWEKKLKEQLLIATKQRKVLSKIG